MFFPGATFADAFDNFVCNFFLPDSASHRAEQLAKAGDAELAPTLEELAESLVSGALDVAGSDVTTLVETLESLRAMGPDASTGNRFTFLLWAMDAQIAHLMVDLARSATARMPTLTALMRRSNVGEATAAFLRRVSRCYLYGFDIECAIMCRSAIEAEFLAEIPTDDCIRLLGRRPARDDEGMFNLFDRIAVAGRTGRLDDEMIDLSHRLRRQTNALLHRTPTVPGNIDDLLVESVNVIEALHRDKTK